MISEFSLELSRIHARGHHLHRVEGIHADVDQIRDRPANRAATVKPHLRLRPATNDVDQLAQAQQELEQLRQSQQQMRQAMRQMSSPPTGAAGAGGNQWGRGAGHAPLGPAKSITPAKTHAVGTVRPSDPGGKVITSWTNQGTIAKGEAQVEFDRAVTHARQEAEAAVTEDRVPKRYHPAVQEYFKLADSE